MDDVQTAKMLVAAECQRIIDLLQNGNLKRSTWDCSTDLSELRYKMRELRRDTVRLDRLLYTMTGR
jgi:hypothetical protein